MVNIPYKNRRITLSVHTLCTKRINCITDYAIYTASPSIASGVEEWYNPKYTATFQYPKETVRF